jgi:hypothetical protein
MTIKVIEEKPESGCEAKTLDKDLIETERTSLATVVESLAVVDQSSYDLATEKSAICAARIKTIEGYYNPRIKQADELHKGLIADRKQLSAPWAAMKAILDGRTTAWYSAEKEKAEDEKRKAEAIQRQIAEDAALKTAQALQDAGLQSAAEEVLAAPVVIAKVEVEGPAKAEGVYYQDRFSAECVDLMALVKSVAEGKTPICYLKADDVTLNGWARSTKGTEAMPGINVVKTTTQGRKQG